MSGFTNKEGKKKAYLVTIQLPSTHILLRITFIAKKQTNFFHDERRSILQE